MFIIFIQTTGKAVSRSYWRCIYPVCSEGSKLLLIKGTFITQK